MKILDSVMLIMAVVILAAPAVHAEYAPGGEIPGQTLGTGNEGPDTTDGTEPVEDEKARIEMAKINKAFRELGIILSSDTERAKLGINGLAPTPDGLHIHLSGPESTETYMERIRDAIGHDVKISEVTHGTPFIPFGEAAEPLENTDGDTTSNDAGDGIQAAKDLTAYEKIAEKMEDPAFITDIPIVGMYQDPDTGTLFIDIRGSGDRDAYEGLIREVVGEDTPIQVSVFSKHSGDLPPGAESCITLRGDCYPMYGGVLITTYINSTHLNTGTLAVGATDKNGTVGFVTAGHLESTDGIFYQPSPNHQDERDTSVGTVKTNPTLDGRDSDAAFVALDGTKQITDRIYNADPTFVYYNVTGSGTPQNNADVQKTGQRTNTTIGYVLTTGYTAYYENGDEVYNQTRALLHSLPGDSGAPVYSPPVNNAVTLYGVLTGGMCLVEVDNIEDCPTGLVSTVFSPWASVASELDLNPVPTEFTKAHEPWIQHMLDLRVDKSDTFRDTFPVETIGDVNRLLAWAGNTDANKAQDNNPELARYDFVYSAMKRWDERPDLQSYIPEATLAEDVQRLVTWAGHPAVQNQMDPAKTPNKDLFEFVETYTLLRYYFLERDDLRENIPQTHEDWDLKSLYCWAGDDGTDIAGLINGSTENSYVTVDGSFKTYYKDACKDGVHHG